MRTTIFVVPALLTPLATAQPAEKTGGPSSSVSVDRKAKVGNEEPADAWEAKKKFAGAVTYAASDYIAVHGVDSDVYRRVATHTCGWQGVAQTGVAGPLMEHVFNVFKVADYYPTMGYRLVLEAGNLKDVERI